jgi:hypothetical protein
VPHLCKPDNGIDFFTFILRPSFERLPGKPLASCGPILSSLARQFPGSAGDYSVLQVLLDAFASLLTGGLAFATTEIIRQFYLHLFHLLPSQSLGQNERPMGWHSPNLARIRIRWRAGGLFLSPLARLF